MLVSNKNGQHGCIKKKKKKRKKKKRKKNKQKKKESYDESGSPGKSKIEEVNGIYQGRFG